MFDNDELLDNIRLNEKIAKKLFEIEARILSIGDFRGLFENLLLLIEEKFEIPHVWISIINENNVFYLINALRSSQLLKERLNLLEKEVFLELSEGKKTPILINEDLKPYYRLLPENQKYFVKSLAIAPLFIDGELIGSLNLGDSSGFRFQPNMDTFFISQLAVKLSICLSNVTARESLKYLATRDPLTLLLNRREMDDTLEKEFSRATRYNTPLALLFIDCDDFKMVNDSYGHKCGDALLKHLADHILRLIRKDDLAFRFAGDEFVIILPNQSSKEAQKALERLRKIFEKHPLRFDDITIPVSFSCGIASTEDQEVKNPADLLKKADERLYKVKKKQKPR
jgi:diguanylate cyclase (GGDEF)-like protein